MSKMIIPVRCHTCGNVLADKWFYFQKKITSDPVAETNGEKDTDPKQEKTIVGNVLDDLKLHSICCRSTMMSTVDFTDKI
jgi:DNA-directed RNA polymerase subunit N